MLRDGKAPSEVTTALGVPLKTAAHWKGLLGITTPQLRPSRTGMRLRPRGLVGEVVADSVETITVPAHLSYGEKVKLGRTMRGLRQEDLAKRAGVSAHTIVHLEQNDPSIKESTKQRVAVALGLAVSDFSSDPPRGNDFYT